MAETLFLCLSYIAESSHKSSESFQGNFAPDDSIDRLEIENDYGSNHVEDVSQLIKWTELFSGIYKTPQNEISTITTPQKSSSKERSVKDNLSVEMGESSRNPSLSHELIESTDGHIAVPGSASSKGTENISPDRVDQASSSSEITTHGNLGAEGDVELDVLMSHAPGPSSTEMDQTRADAELFDQELSVLGKGKQPIRPAVWDTSMLEGKIDQTGDANQLDDKGKQPLRSALKQSFLPYSVQSQQHGNSWLISSSSLTSDAARTIVQFVSGQSNNEEDDVRENKTIADRESGNFESEDDKSEEDEEYNGNDDCDLDEMELKGLLEAILNANPGSAISVKPYTNTATSEDVFLFNHGIIIPRKDAGKLAYGVAIPGKIFRRKKSRYPSTSALLMELAKTKLDILGIETRRPEIIRTLILEDAEEAYRKEKYGYSTWLGIIKERKNRYDPETRQWKSILHPSQWRRHGLALPEGQDPPENSCKFRMVTLCGQILHQWFVRCDNKRAFGPREIIAKISCGKDHKCEKFSYWEPESGPLIHDNSVKGWIEIDPDKEGVDLSKEFYPFMKSWIVEGPPKVESPPGCMKINCVTKCGFVKSRIRLLCHRHISKKPKCIGGEFTMLIDRGCALRDDIHRCDEKTVCEGYLDWIQAKLGLPADKLTPTQVYELDKLHVDLTSAYEKERHGMGSFLKHEGSEKRWKDVVYNHVDMYNMLFDWGLRTIRYPEGLSVVRAEESVIG